MRIISIIVVNYKSDSSITRLISSLEKLNAPVDVSIRLLLLDSSGELSHEDYRHLSGSEYFDVELISLPENRGFAYAVNVGLATALARGTEYLWLLNPDIVVCENALMQLLDNAGCAEGPLILGSLVLEEGVDSLGEPKVWGFGGFIDAEGAVSMGQSIADDPISSDYIPGCSVFFSAEVARKTGYLPEEYFLYFEETEWCKRAAERGVGMLNLPQSRVWHISPEAKMQEPWRVYFYNRSEILFRYRNFIKNSSRLAFLIRELKNLSSTFHAYLKSPTALRQLFRAHVLLHFDVLKIVCFFMSSKEIAKLSRLRLDSLKKG